MIAPLRDRLVTPAVVRVAQIAIGAIFLAAALAKIPDMPTFAKQVGAYELAPRVAQHAIAMTLPWIELVAGLSLVFGIRRRAGGIVALVSMAAFTFAVAWAWHRGLSIDCGCFGKALPEPVELRKIFENVGLTALAAVAILKTKIVS